MKALGRHLLAEYFDCATEVLNDPSLLEKICVEAAEIAGSMVVSSHFKTFSPWGVSGVVIIAESHIAIHTWPEYGFAAADVFTCGETVDPWKAHDYMRRAMQAKNVKVIEQKRGELDIPDLRHKPTEHSSVQDKVL